MDLLDMGGPNPSEPQPSADVNNLLDIGIDLMGNNNAGTTATGNTNDLLGGGSNDLLGGSNQIG